MKNYDDEIKNLTKNFTPNLSDLLQQIKDAYTEHAIISEEQADMLTLWTAHTYATSSARYTPYMWITSATPRSGKSRIIEIAKLLVDNPKKSDNISASALGRFTFGRTILLDEADKQMRDSEKREAIMANLNSGYEEDGTYTRVGGAKNDKEEEFKTFSAKMIAGIGSKYMTDTLVDRSIMIRMARKYEQQKLPRFRKRNLEPKYAPVREGLTEYFSDDATLFYLYDVEPAFPEELNDRQADILEPLFAIADMASPEWGEIMRRVAVTLCAAEEEEVSLNVSLLRNISEFMKSDMHSAEICEQLNEKDEWDWNTFNAYKVKSGINQKQLSNYLKDFGIHPDNIRINGVQRKGYRLNSHMKDCFERYSTQEGVPDVPSVPPDTKQTYEEKRNTAVPLSVPEYEPNNAKVTDVTDGTDTLREYVYDPNNPLSDAQQKQKFNMNWDD